MRAGALRDYVEVQQKAVTTAVDGNVTETWSTFLACRAQIGSFQGAERFAAGQVLDRGTVPITMRFTPGISPDMRVKFVDVRDNSRQRYFNIQAVENIDQRSVTLMLTCIEVRV